MPAICGELAGAVISSSPCAAEQHHLVAELGAPVSVTSSSSHVHGHRAGDRHPPAAHQGLGALPVEPPGVAVGVAHRHDRDAARPRGHASARRSRPRRPAAPRGTGRSRPRTDITGSSPPSPARSAAPPDRARRAPARGAPAGGGSPAWWSAAALLARCGPAPSRSAGGERARGPPRSAGPARRLRGLSRPSASAKCESSPRSRSRGSRRRRSSTVGASSNGTPSRLMPVSTLRWTSLGRRRRRRGGPVAPEGELVEARDGRGQPVAAVERRSGSAAPCPAPGSAVATPARRISAPSSSSATPSQSTPAASSAAADRRPRRGRRRRP